MDFKIAIVKIPLNGNAVGKTISQLKIPEECRIICLFHGGRLDYAYENKVLRGGEKIVLCGPSARYGFEAAVPSLEHSS
jgi:Trk K+ transport system NAD-binding subunit